MNYWNTTNYWKILSYVKGSRLSCYYPEMILSPACLDAQCSELVLFETKLNMFKKNCGLLDAFLGYEETLLPGYYYSSSGIIIGRRGKLTVL